MKLTDKLWAAIRDAAGLDDRERPAFTAALAAIPEPRTDVEVWALEWDNPIEAANAYVGPALDDDGTASFLAFPSLEQARSGALFQKEMYDCDCHPVCLLQQLAGQLGITLLLNIADCLQSVLDVAGEPLVKHERQFAEAEVRGRRLLAACKAIRREIEQKEKPCSVQNAKPN
jgi:hypothetical protein